MPRAMRRTLAMAVLFGMFTVSSAHACFRPCIEEELFFYPLIVFLWFIALPACGVVLLSWLLAGPKLHATVRSTVVLLANGLLLALLDLASLRYALEVTESRDLVRAFDQNPWTPFLCLGFLFLAPFLVMFRMRHASGAIPYLLRQLRWTLVIPFLWSLAILMDSGRGLWDVERTFGLGMFLGVFAMMHRALPAPLRIRWIVPVPAAPDPELAALTAAPVETRNGSCPVCRSDLDHEEQVACDCCGTPHHRSCWSYLSGCAMFGCRGR